MSWWRRTTGPLRRRSRRACRQHFNEKRLYRHVAEFDFSYNNRIALGVGDVKRSDNALGGIVGKRLTYRDLSVAGA